MLAREFANVVLGAIAQDAIQTMYLPVIRRAIMAAKTDQEKERLQERLDEWTLYSDPRKHEAGIWNALAAKIIHKEVKNNNRGPDDVEEISQITAQDFMSNPRMLKTTFGKFDPTDSSVTVKDVQRVWNRAINFHTKMILQKWRREEAKLQRGDEDYDPLANIPALQERSEAEIELDRQVYKKLEKDLVRFMNRALRDDSAEQLFEVWHDLAKKKGPENVVLKYDVYPKLWEQGETLDEKRLSEKWRDITRLLVRFWETPVDQGGAGVRVPDRLKKKLRVSMVTRIAEDAWRSRVCSWMLSVVPPTYRKA
jgi:hypothetical protein